MSKSFNTKQVGLAVACALALGILSGPALAQDASPQTAKDRSYLDDTRDKVVRSGFGLCWHTGFGPPPAAGPECDPNYVAYVAPPAPAPAPIVQSAPVPAPTIAAAPPPAVAVAPAVVVAPAVLPPAQAYVPPQRPAKKDRN